MSDQTKREILRPLMNVPITLALRYATPLEVEGRYGNQMMFTVMHQGEEKLIFFDPTTAQRITDLGLAAGEQVTITKQESNQGRKKGIQWQIERKPEGQRQGGSPAAADSAASRKPREQSESQPIEAQRNTAAARGQVVAMPGGAAAAETELMPLRTASEVMGAAMRAAIDALVIAGEYAATRGFSLKWNEEDVRATAASIYIQHHRDASFGVRTQQPAAAGGSR